MRDIYHSVYLLKRSPGSPSCREQQIRRAIQDILSSPDCKGGHIPLQPEIWTPREGSGLDWTNRDLMKQLFGWPAVGHWRLLKPSRVTLRGLTRSKGKDHRLIPTAEVGVGPEITLEVGPELALEVALEIVLEPIVKVTLMVTYGACILSPPMNLLPGEE